MMYALAQAFLTGREMGESEAYYKLEPSLHYKQSNIKTIFIASGFPQNRSHFLRRCKTEDESKRGFAVDNHEGKFMMTENIHSKYPIRPACIEMMVMTQFGMRLTDVSPQQSKKIRESGRIPAPPAPEQGYKGTLTIVTAEDDDTIDLPDFIELQNGKIMRLRKFDAVVRRHKFKCDKEEHEFFFSELLLFFPWRNESELFPDDANKCQELYLTQKINIDKIKRKLFPHLVEVELGRAMVENFDEHAQAGIQVDPQGEQEKDQDLIAEMAAEYGGLDPEGLEEEENVGKGKGSAAPFFRAAPVLEMDDIKERTRKLAWEQMAVLQRVLNYTNDLVMSRNAVRRPTVKPPLMIIHGGAGTGKSTLINNISLWVQKLMITAGDDTDCPYLLRLAPTGMAASNIQGQTLHSGLKFKFGNKFESLSDKTRDILRDQYRNVKIIIIDEMSMIRSDQLFHLHLRLQEIMNNDLVFGGLSLLLLGIVYSLPF